MGLSPDKTAKGEGIVRYLKETFNGGRGERGFFSRKWPLRERPRRVAEKRQAEGLMCFGSGQFQKRGERRNLFIQNSVLGIV